MCYPTFSSRWCGGAVSSPAGAGAEPRRQTHFGTNVLKINSKSGPFSVAVYAYPNSDPISDVHWLLQRKIGSVVRGCEIFSGGRHDVTTTWITLVTDSPSLFGGMKAILECHVIRIDIKPQNILAVMLTCS